MTPGRGGEEVEGLPVFATVKEAAAALGGIDASVLFIPGPGVKDAALEALNNGVKLLVIVPDRVPVQDVLEISAASRDLGARLRRPEHAGRAGPDRWVLGMMGGRAESARKFFKRGPVGVTSRSGGITSSIAYYLGKAGVGASTIVHVGGDPVVGLPHPEIVRLFQDDPETAAIVMFGEIGGSQEEQVAELIAAGVVTKPVIAYIGGKGAKEGTRFSHAGAIIEGGRGTREGKIEALTQAGRDGGGRLRRAAGSDARSVEEQRDFFVGAKPCFALFVGATLGPPMIWSTGVTARDTDGGQRRPRLHTRRMHA